MKFVFYNVKLSGDAAFYITLTLEQDDDDDEEDKDSTTGNYPFFL